uniref:Uncharacterized protein n=1 Tax=Acrobeloides nanus TaxID=290746 RepID=A0A914C360_9BILA
MYFHSSSGWNGIKKKKKRPVFFMRRCRERNFMCRASTIYQTVVIIASLPSIEAPHTCDFLCSYGREEGGAAMIGICSINDQEEKRRLSYDKTKLPVVSTTGSPPSASSFLALNADPFNVLLNQRMSGMKRATTLSEWQLQAVLFKAKLTQYYDTFISAGGDDIDQIMQCDEQEFLEIMSLVGMASKPLHVRRLQRTLSEFSMNRALFLQNAVTNIGPPPLMDISGSSSAENLQAALQFLIPGFLANSSMEIPSVATPLLTASGESTPSNPAISSSNNNHRASSGLIIPASTVAMALSSLPSSTATTTIGATANVLPMPADNVLSMLVGSSNSAQGILTSSFPFAMSALCAPSTSTRSNTVLSPDSDTGEYVNPGSATGEDPTSMLYHLFEIPTLSDNDVTKLAKCAKKVMEEFPKLQPKLIQNKKKISKDLLDAMNLPPGHPNRLSEFRRYSAIYGRFDAKRKPDKALTFHEVLVNEAAAQICLLQPSLLTRRDELFPLARKVVREAGFPGLKSMSRQDPRSKRPYDSKSDRSHSPHSSISTSSSPVPDEFLVEDRGRSESVDVDADDSPKLEDMPVLEKRQRLTTQE